MNVLFDVALKNLLARVRNDLGAYLTVAFKQTHYDGFTVRTTRLNPLFADTLVHVARLAADKRFIYFDFSVQLHKRSGLHRPDVHGEA